jgi:hypothetical protein
MRSTHGAEQRLIWWSRHGRVRLAKKLSVHERSRKTFCSALSVWLTAPALAKGLVADVCDRLDANRDHALHAAAQVAGHHDVLTSVGLVVEATTAETRRRLLG